MAGFIKKIMTVYICPILCQTHFISLRDVRDGGSSIYPLREREILLNMLIFQIVWYHHLTIMWSCGHTSKQETIFFALVINFWNLIYFLLSIKKMFSRLLYSINNFIFPLYTELLKFPNFRNCASRQVIGSCFYSKKTGFSLLPLPL